MALGLLAVLLFLPLLIIEITGPWGLALTRKPPQKLSTGMRLHLREVDQDQVRAWSKQFNVSIQYYKIWYCDENGQLDYWIEMLVQGTRTQELLFQLSVNQAELPASNWKRLGFGTVTRVEPNDSNS